MYCIIHYILNFCKQRFNGQFDVVWSLHAFLVCGKVGVTDEGLGVVEVGYDLEGDDVGKSDATVADGGDKHVIDGTE